MRLFTPTKVVVVVLLILFRRNLLRVNLEQSIIGHDYERLELFDRTIMFDIVPH